MFELSKTFGFEAGHSLTYHDGRCKNPHGHSYLLTLRLSGNSLESDGPKKNMLVDFQDISKVVKPMIDDYFEHKWLNDTLENDSPTSEFIAKWIYDYLIDKLPLLESVTLAETTSSSVTYRPIN